MNERYDSLNIAKALQDGDEETPKKIDIWLNKQFNEQKYKANQMGMLSHCRLCGKQLSGKVNSHSVPQMILKNIETKGEYVQPTVALNKGAVFGPFGRMNRFGLNNAGTFHLICHECDKHYFSDYEKPELWEQVSIDGEKALSDMVLAEIYLKSALRERYKKEFALNFDILTNARYDSEGIPQNIATISYELSVREDDTLIDRCKRIIEEGLQNQFQIIHLDVLEHSSNIAAQALFPIQKVPTDEIINNVFNLNPDYRIVLIEMVVFPLKDKTICLSFCLSEDVERLLPFIRYLNGLSKTAKRKLFQSTLFAYTEEIYMNEEMVNVISKDGVTMSFIGSALEHGTTSSFELEQGIVAEEPKLVSTKNFRKAILHI